MRFLLEWISGTGKVSLTIKWPKGITTFDEIRGIISNGTTTKTFEKSIIGLSSPQFSQTISGLETGTYGFVLKFYNGGNEVGLTYMDQINIYNGMTSSGICTIPENLLPIEKPVITPAEGSRELMFGDEITISHVAGDALIYYTIDGSDPRSSVTACVYSQPFSLEQNATVKAIALASSRFTSEIEEAEFTVHVATPEFMITDIDLVSGTHTLMLTSATKGVTFWYTLAHNDDQPSELLTFDPEKGISLEKGSYSITAYATKPNMLDSASVTEGFEISEKTTGIEIIDPVHVVFSINLTDGLADAVVVPNATGTATVVINSQSGEEGALSYAWYLDGTVAKDNQGNSIPSSSNILKFGTGQDEIALKSGQHVLVVKVTKGSMTYSEQKVINVASPVASVTKDGVTTYYTSLKAAFISLDADGVPNTTVDRYGVYELSGTATMTILRDITFASTEQWIPVNIPKTARLTINGNNKTIRNLNVDKAVYRGRANNDGSYSLYYGTGFIGGNEGTLIISDLTFEKANIQMKAADGVNKQGSSQSGVVIGRNWYGTATLTNVNVINSKILGYTKVAGMVGHSVGDLEIAGGKVTGCTIGFDNLNQVREEGYSQLGYVYGSSAGAVIGLLNSESSGDNANFIATDIELSGNTFLIDPLKTVQLFTYMKDASAVYTNYKYTEGGNSKNYVDMVYDTFGVYRPSFANAAPNDWIVGATVAGSGKVPASFERLDNNMSRIPDRGASIPADRVGNLYSYHHERGGNY